MSTVTRKAIPDVHHVQDVHARRALDALKYNLEALVGLRGGKIATLGPTSTLGEVINKVNEIINKLQAT